MVSELSDLVENLIEAWLADADPPLVPSASVRELESRLGPYDDWARACRAGRNGGILTVLNKNGDTMIGLKPHGHQWARRNLSLTDRSRNEIEKSPFFPTGAA